MDLVTRECDLPALTFDWGAIKWLCNQELMPDAAMTFGLVWIRAGEANALHYHPNCEELLLVLSGACDHQLGDQVYQLKPGSLIRIPTGVPHRARVTGWEPLRAVIVYSTPDRQTVILEE